MPLFMSWKLSCPWYSLVPDLLTESMENPPARSKLRARAPPLTTVTWSMHGETPYWAKIFHVFFNMDTMVGGDFENGLAKLKAAAEK